MEPGSNQAVGFASLMANNICNSSPISSKMESKTPAATPALESPVQGVPLTKHFRQVSPRSTSSANPNHPLQRHAVVVAVPARLTRSIGQYRFDEVPLPVTQSENHFQTGPLSTPRSYEVIVPMAEMIFIEDINGQVPNTIRSVSVQDHTP